MWSRSGVPHGCIILLREVLVTDEYTTISKGCRREIKVQGSRFIADAMPAEDASAAENFIASIRREFHDATHHCYAYRLQGDEVRSNDDGEPGGTAGRPILGSIDHDGLVGVIVVVTRYFGGVKLGPGGLARSYAEAARLALSGAPRERRYRTETLLIAFPHAVTGTVMHLLEQTGAAIMGTSYDEEAHLTVEIRRSKAQEFRRAVIEQTGGKAKLSA